MKYLAYHALIFATATAAADRLGFGSDPLADQRRQTSGVGASYYINQHEATNGDGTSPESPFDNLDDALDALGPGDTLYLMGTISNPSYDPNYSYSGDVNDPHLWHYENTLKLNKLHGTAGAPISIKPYDSSAVVKGDGSNIVRINDCSYLRIEGLEIYGEVENIPLSTAEACQFLYRDADGVVRYRVEPGLTAEEVDGLTLPILGSNVPRVSYTDTRGVYVSKCHHVTLENNKIHHIPGNGLRVAYSEYVDIIGNEVYATSRKSYSGTHGLTATYTKDDISGGDIYRVRILNNLVYDNYNEVYSWVGTKDFIEARIDEGKGISLQRNQLFTNGGRILVANNIAYGNGYSGVHSQDGDNVDILHNTAYMNSYTNSVWYGGTIGGKNVGISVQGGSGNVIANNVAVVDTDVRGRPINVAASTSLTASNNLVFGFGDRPLKHDDETESSTVEMDPMFANAEAGNFAPLTGSPLIQGGDPSFSYGVDYFGTYRDAVAPTIGAVEEAQSGSSS